MTIAATEMPEDVVLGLVKMMRCFDEDRVTFGPVGARRAKLGTVRRVDGRLVDVASDRAIREAWDLETREGDGHLSEPTARALSDETGGEFHARATLFRGASGSAGIRDAQKAALREILTALDALSAEDKLVRAALWHSLGSFGELSFSVRCEFIALAAALERDGGEVVWREARSGTRTGGRVYSRLNTLTREAKAALRPHISAVSGRTVIDLDISGCYFGLAATLLPAGAEERATLQAYADDTKILRARVSAAVPGMEEREIKQAITSYCNRDRSRRCADRFRASFALMPGRDWRTQSRHFEAFKAVVDPLADAFEAARSRTGLASSDFFVLLERMERQYVTTWAQHAARRGTSVVSWEHDGLTVVGELSPQDIDAITRATNAETGSRLSMVVKGRWGPTRAAESDPFASLIEDLAGWELRVGASAPRSWGLS